GSSKLTSRNVFPLRRPSPIGWVPERCSQSRVRFAAPKTGAPLTAARRSGPRGIATGGSGGNTSAVVHQDKKAGFPHWEAGLIQIKSVGLGSGLDRSLHIRTTVSMRVAFAGRPRR